tara:strand:+ start:36 stop:350 length:315 start_codon:yes stop_codon:yes gene_type:complete
MTVKNQLTQKEIISLATILINFTAVDEIIIDDIEICVRGRKGDSTGTCGEAVYRTKDTSVILADLIAKCAETDKALKEMRKHPDTANEKIALLDAYEKKVKNRK